MSLDKSSVLGEIVQHPLYPAMGNQEIAGVYLGALIDDVLGSGRYDTHPEAMARLHGLRELCPTMNEVIDRILVDAQRELMRQQIIYVSTRVGPGVGEEETNNP